MQPGSLHLPNTRALLGSLDLALALLVRRVDGPDITKRTISPRGWIDDSKRLCAPRRRACGCRVPVSATARSSFRVVDDNSAPTPDVQGPVAATYYARHLWLSIVLLVIPW